MAMEFGKSMGNIAEDVYKDLLQPTTKVLGEGLETITKAVFINTCIAPLREFVWNYERLQELNKELAQKLVNVPIEQIQPPDPHVAVPILQAITYTGHHQELREMYAKLLATAMDSETARISHPSFVEIVKQLTPDEAKIITVFKQDEEIAMVDVIKVSKAEGAYECVKRNVTSLARKTQLSCPDLTSSYIDNLVRLGLLNINDVPLVDEDAYSSINIHPIALESGWDFKNRNFYTKKRSLYLNEFGKQFCKACIED